jgi:hypothetical protein
MTAPVRLTGGFRVGLPPEEAFRLFTPRGEQEWVEGWEPRFPADVVDDTEPGTVFETAAHGPKTIWLVIARERGRRISYARITPDEWAGSVTVTVEGAGEGSDVEVVYELTALTDAAGVRLKEFADGYAGYLRSWEEAILVSRPELRR